MQDHYRLYINTSHVIHEDFDDEAIVVDLESGAYYAFRHTAHFLWTRLAEGASPAELTGALTAAYVTTEAECRPDVHHFLQQLLDETLIAVSEAVEPRPQAPGQGTAGGKRRTYVAPAFDRYTDMAELLLIDPVHDVDEAGWPQQSPRNEAGLRR